MISLEEVEKTILELEQKDTSYAVCEKLAYLYIVKDHIKPASAQEFRFGSEFIRAISGKDSGSVLKILDELMSTLKIVQSKLYDAVIAEINNI